MDILKHIQPGRHNAITREELVHITHRCDREVRQAIEDERRNGALIINLNGWIGYWISDDPKEIAQYIKQEENRLKSIGARLKAPRRFLKSESAQTTANS